MFGKLTRRLSIEAGHFMALKKDVKLVLFSYAFFLIAYPLVMTFMDAYLWRTTGNLWAIIYYNLGFCIGLPVGFYLNGILLRKFHVLHLYFAGAVLQGLAAFLVVFFAAEGFANILLLGIVFGIGSGLFWGNKNYLSLQQTRDTNRVYYNSLEQIIDLLINIVVPIATGWFIVFSGGSQTAGVSASYKIVMAVGFAFLFLSGFVIQFSKIPDVKISGLTVRKPTREWQLLRVFNVSYNLAIGISLALSSVLILVLVGGEDVLGTFQAVTALLSSVFLYFIGRKSSTKTSWKLVAIGSIVYFSGALALAGIFTWVGSLLYSLSVTVAWAFQWTSSYSVSMELMDFEESDPEKQYSRVCDNELFFNIGRGFGIAIVVAFIAFAGESFALRWSPLLVAGVQLPMFLVTYVLGRHVQSKKLDINPEAV